MKKVRVANKKRFVFFISVVLMIILLIGSFTMSAFSSEGLNQDNFENIRVEQGDTLWSIAKLYAGNHTDVREVIYNIQKENDLISSVIHPGQELKIPIQ